MKYWLNESGKPQVFMTPDFREVVPDRYGVTDRAAKRFSVDPMHSSCMTCFRDFKTAAQHRASGKMVLHRTSALGDVLMMMALAHHIGADCSFDRERFKEFDAAYKPDLSGGIGIILDGEAEVDHVDSVVQTRHRIDLMSDAVGVKVDGFEWRMPFSVPVREVERFDVLFQAGGSTNVKQLHPALTRPIMAELVGDGLKVGLIGMSADYQCPAGVADMRGKTDLWTLWNLIGSTKALVTQDSAPLWIAHFTKTPVVLLCGPTHAESRLSRHQAPHCWIDLSGMVGCRPCGELGTRCEQRFDCMSPRYVPLKTFRTELMERLNRLEVL
jgi:hypothetical protein